MVNSENQYTETDLGNISFNPKGEYDNDIRYEYLDTVSYEGGSYMCVVEVGSTVAGISPTTGKNTDVWQMISLPGGLTPEYIAAHDDVINNSKIVESSKVAVEKIRKEVEADLDDINLAHSQITETETKIETYRDEVVEYAHSAENSKNVSERAAENVNTLISGFDSHVEEQTANADVSIVDARQTAIQAVKSQEETSIAAVKNQTSDYISEKEIHAKNEISKHVTSEIEKADSTLTSIKDDINVAAKLADEKNKILNSTIQNAENLNTEIGEAIDQTKSATIAANKAAVNANEAASTATEQIEKTKAVTDTLVAQINHLSFQVDPTDGGLNIIYTE